MDLEHPKSLLGAVSYHKGVLFVLNRAELLPVCCQRGFSQKVVVSETSDLLCRQPCGEQGLRRWGENGKGVWKEAGCQQEVDGLTRRTSFAKLECALHTAAVHAHTAAACCL